MTQPIQLILSIALFINALIFLPLVIRAIQKKPAVEDKRVQEQLLAEANYARLAFISTAAHEVRGPISTVITLSAAMKENLMTLQDLLPKTPAGGASTFPLAAVHKTLDAVLDQSTDLGSEAERGLLALQNLSNLHRMQLYGVVPHMTCFNVKQLLRFAIKESTYKNFKEVTVEQHVSKKVPENVLIDAQHVMAALSIVIGNAFRFSHERSSIHINVDVNQKDSPSALVISVQDLGVGMHVEQIRYLLTPTAHLMADRESIYLKPSVQLSRAKMYLAASGGSLAINSVLHKGTTVTLTVPYALPTESAVSRMAIEESVFLEESGGEKQQPYTVHAPIGSVLLVEDDEIAQKMTCENLIGLGYSVDACGSGENALRHMAEKHYDIVLLDISLPDISGLEVMRKIRASQGDGVIVIAVSSHASAEDEDYFISQGAMALMGKPLKIQKLKNTLEVLRGK